MAQGHLKAKQVLLVIRSMVLIALLGTCWYVLSYYPLDNKPRVFCSLDTGNKKFLVVGTSDGPLGGWSMLLYVKKENPPWAAYYLDHEAAYWPSVSMNQSKDHVYILRAKQTVGDLDLRTLLFNDYARVRPRLDCAPIFLIDDNDPFNQGAVINTGYGKWPQGWPMPPQ